MENTTDYLKPYLLLICRKKQKIGTGKVRDNNIVNPIITKASILAEENIKIVEARNRLLPKLMSGEIEL